MRTQLITFCAAVTVLTISAGCNKYLDKEPDNRASINSVDKVNQLLASAYPKANYLTFAETSTDNVGDRLSGASPNETLDPYTFRDVRSDLEDSPEFYWDACYNAIASANFALQAANSAADPTQYSAQKGEALVARAYAHFMLVTFFSKFYDPATAATDPGIPYVTEPENVVIKQYDRKTVKYVYDMIEKDLTEGLPLIKDETYKVKAYHFTRAAAHAFAARFYLFKKDYAKVLEHTNQVVPAGAGVIPFLRPWNTAYIKMTRLELFAVYTQATQPANLLLCETNSAYLRNYASGRFAYDVTTFNEIGIDVPVLSDAGRVQWAFAYQSYGGDNTVYIPKLNEYFVRASVNADIGDPYIMAPLFTMEETLFNQAEALTYLGNTNDAIALLNIYLSTRINNYSPTNPNYMLTDAKITAHYSTTLSDGLIKTILDLKRAEFIHEGIRWFDILRYKIPVVHYKRDEATPYTLAADSKYRVFQIPQTAVLSGLALNPR